MKPLARYWSTTDDVDLFVEGDINHLCVEGGIHDLFIEGGRINKWARIQ